MKRTAVCLISIVLSASAAGFVAAEKTYDVSEVKVIRTDSGVMYAYRDSSGQLIVQDVPPPGYLESLTVEQAQQKAVPVGADEPPVAMPVSQDKPARRFGPTIGFLTAVLLAVASAYVFFAPWFRRWRRESKLERFFRRAGVPVFTDLQLAGSGHRPTVIDCLARTPAGILVIAYVRLAGRVSGHPDHDFWLHEVRNKPEQIDNPLRKNAGDTRIVEALLPDVPVHGRVVYSGHAELPTELQTSLQKLSEFAQNLNFFETAAPDQRRLDGGWRTLMRYPRTNQVALRPMGTGWKRWLRHHWRGLASSGLLATSVTIMSVLLLLQWLTRG